MSQSKRNDRPANRLLGKVAALLLIQLIWLPSVFFAAAQTGSTTARRKPHKTVRPMIPAANRNQNNKDNLEYADRLSFREQYGVGADEQYQVLAGNVRLRKGAMHMYCDSAQIFEATNSVNAFGNVRMEQGDTLFVFADILEYDGITEEAVLFADVGNKVRLINRDVTLTTDVFHYDMANEIGYYEVGGVLVDKQNRLESWIGEYYPQTKDSYFEQDVHLTSRQKGDVTYINTDRLEYNTDTHIARLLMPSEIINRDGTIYTSDGVYNTAVDTATLYSRSTVVTSRGNTLTGDMLFYDRVKQYGEAFGNMILTDSVRQASLLGNYGFYDEARDSAFVTGRALSKEYSKGDTLYLHGDTIIAYLDLADSTHVTNVFHRVRFFRSDLQGICDSLSMTERDSILYMYRAPVVWSGERQIFGNVINVHMADSTVDWARLPQFGLMAEHIAEDCYNQISGTDMTAWFADSTVERLYVEGNVMLDVFPMESDSSYNKFAYVESSYMDAYFKDNNIESIHFWPETNSTVTPLYLAKRGSYFLPKFQWYEDIRPISPEDVFIVPQEMIDLISKAEPVITTPAVRKTDASRPNPNSPPHKREAPESLEPAESTEAAESPEPSDDSDNSDNSDTPDTPESPVEPASQASGSVD